MPLWGCCGSSTDSDHGNTDDAEHSSAARCSNNRRTADHRDDTCNDETLAHLVSLPTEDVHLTTYRSSENHTSSAMSLVTHSGPKCYRLLTLIGDGSYGGVSIWMAQHVPSRQLVAIKSVDFDKCELPYSLVQHEVRMHRLLQHKNTLSALCCPTHGMTVWMVMPLMSYGSCRDLLHAHFKDGLPEMAAAYILRDVLQAIDYLHNRGIIHRDIKASHILVQADGGVRLSGFRHCLSMTLHGQRRKSVHDFPDFYVHSLNWASRELLEQNLSGYDTKSDIYSIGITACELANGVVPFQDMPLTQMLVSKIEGTTPRLLDLTTLPELNDTDSPQKSTECHSSLLLYQRTFSKHFHNFVDVCLLSEPISRPTAAALSGHEMLKQIHRKHNPPPLTELLRPLNPISASGVSLPDDTVVETLAERLDEVGIEEDWVF